MPPEASKLVVFGIGGLAVFVALLFVWGFTVSSPARSRSFIIGLLGVTVWMGVSAALARSGVLAQFERRPPPMGILFATLFVASLGLGLSPLGWRFAERIPIALLVLAQGFRLPLELVMHQAAHEGVMPVQMSYAGLNFDIVTGASALVVGLLALKGKAPRGLIIAWDVAGILLLVNILVVAIVALPFIHAFGTEPEKVNSWVAYFPFVWLPSVLVPAAIFGHVVISRRLFSTAREYAA